MVSCHPTSINISVDVPSACPVDPRRCLKQTQWLSIPQLSSTVVAVAVVDADAAANDDDNDVHAGA